MMRLILVTAALIVSFAVSAKAIEISDFFGTYVGVATDFDSEGNEIGERDVDMIVSPYRNKGFTLDLITLRLVDGRRDKTGVVRRSSSTRFVAGKKKNMFVADKPVDPFAEREEQKMFAGKSGPVQWAYIDGDALVINTFAVLADGRFEWQLYERSLTETGMDIGYTRIVDGEVRRKITGRLVSVE